MARARRSRTRSSSRSSRRRSKACPTSAASRRTSSRAGAARRRSSADVVQKFVGRGRASARSSQGRPDDLQRQRAADAHRSRSREGDDARRAGARGVRNPAEHVRRAVRERLQPLRPRVPGAAAVGAALPRVSRGHPQRLRAREVGRAGAADRARQHPRGEGPGDGRALQRVHVGEDPRQRGAGLQLGRRDRGDGRGGARSAAARATRSPGRAPRTRKRSAAARPTASTCSAC